MERIIEIDRERGTAWLYYKRGRRKYLATMAAVDPINMTVPQIGQLLFDQREREAKRRRRKKILFNQKYQL